MNGGALTRHRVTVVKEFAQIPLLRLDKARTMQILVNLFSNAKHAMDAMTDRTHQVLLQASVVDGNTLRICVTDNGEGIPAENLTRVFMHGYTTCKEGHGFGRHNCALGATEMGGALLAHSDGAGQGATFTLELPIDMSESG